MATATLISYPSALCLAGNIEPVRVSAAGLFTFRLKKGSTVLLEEDYVPDSSGQAEIDIRDIILSDLSLSLPTSDVYKQASAAGSYTIATDTDTKIFKAVLGGIERPATDAATFLQANFLTWQPQIKSVTYDQPEWLSFYTPATAIALKAKFYLKDGTTDTVTVAGSTSFDADCIYSVNVQFARLWNMGEGDRYGMVDVWLEDDQSTALTYVQRYVLDTSGDERTVLVARNSLGGIDTFSFLGSMERSAEAEHTNVMRGETMFSGLVDMTRTYTVNTGILSGHGRDWVWDLQRSPQAWVLMDGALRGIVMLAPAVTASMYEDSTGTVDFLLCDDSGYLNMPRLESLPENIEVPGPDGEVFFLAPRLVDFQDCVLDQSLLIPVQSPLLQEWRKLSVGGLSSYILSLVDDKYESSIHVHDNLEVLSKLSVDDNGKLMFDGGLVGGGSGLAEHDHHGETIRPDKIIMGDVEITCVDGRLHISKGLVSEGDLAAFGAEEGEEGGSGGLDIARLWEELAAEDTSKVIDESHLPSSVVLQDELIEILDDYPLATEMNEALSGKAALQHTHAISEVTGLQSALDSKWEWNASQVAGVKVSNAFAADKLASSVKINGTDFNGESDIVTARWGSARTITVWDFYNANKQAAQGIDGSADFALKLPQSLKVKTLNIDGVTLSVVGGRLHVDSTLTADGDLVAYGDGEGSSSSGGLDIARLWEELEAEDASKVIDESHLPSSVVLQDELTDALAPYVKTTAMNTALAGKAALRHTHAISEVTGLQSALNSKWEWNASQVAGVKVSNAFAADKLASSVKINGTDFNGESDIVTARWGSARSITVTDNFGANSWTGSGVDGSENIKLYLPKSIKVEKLNIGGVILSVAGGRLHVDGTLTASGDLVAYGDEEGSSGGGLDEEAMWEALGGSMENKKISALYLPDLPKATTSVLGGVKLRYDSVQTTAAQAATTTPARTYGVQVDSSGRLVVNVPWEDYSSADLIMWDWQTTLEGKIDAMDSAIAGKAAASHEHPLSEISNLGSGWSDVLDGELGERWGSLLNYQVPNWLEQENLPVNGYLPVNGDKGYWIATDAHWHYIEDIDDLGTGWAAALTAAKPSWLTSVPKATDSAYGGFKTGYPEATGSRYYAVELNTLGQAYVHVPWTDTNTTYTLASFGITATAGEINKLDGVTATTAEINYLDGVTSSIQTQLNGKVPTSRTINGIALSSNITLDGADIKLTGYTEGSSTAVVAAGDTINAALAKLQNQIQTKAASSSLSSYLPLAGGTMTGSIYMGTSHYIYGYNETNGSMLHFDGTRTVVGSYGAHSTAATHIRSKTGHATIGAGNTASYTILDTGNYTSHLDSRYVNVSGDTMTGMLRINSTSEALTQYQINGTKKAAHGYLASQGAYMYSYPASKYLHITDAGSLLFGSSTVWHSGNDGSGSGLDADLLDGLHSSSFASSTNILSNTGSTTGYYKILINSTSPWMLYFRIRLYQSYNYYDIDISGYNYHSSETNYSWYSPKAKLVSSDVSSINVYFGHDSANKLWVAVPARQYTGLAIYDITNGYSEISRFNAFTITRVSSLSGTTDSTQTCHRGASINDNVASATKLATARTLWGQSFDGTGNVSGGLTGATYVKNDAYYIGDAANGISKAGALVYAYGANPIYFYTNSEQRMIVSSSGNVGIGTTSPSYKLDVAGTFRATDKVILGNSSGCDITLARTNYNYIGTPAGGYISFNTNGVTHNAASADLTIFGKTVFPGTNNAVQMGISSKRWANVYSVLGNFSGLITASAGVQIGSTDDIGWYWEQGSRIGAGDQVARGVNVGSLLVSNAWADYTKVPTNGIYCKGNMQVARIGVGSSPHNVYAIFTNGDAYLYNTIYTGEIHAQGDIDCAFFSATRLYVPSSEGNNKYYIRIE